MPASIILCTEFSNNCPWDKKGCSEIDFTGKPMKGFLFIYPEGFDNEENLDFWIHKAPEFNSNIAKRELIILKITFA